MSDGERSTVHPFPQLRASRAEAARARLELELLTLAQIYRGYLLAGHDPQR